MKQLVIAVTLVVAGGLWAGELIQDADFSQSDLIFTQVQGYDVVELRGCVAAVMPGEPRLPRLVQSVLIPAGAIPTSVEIVSDNSVEIRGIFKIVPAQPDVPLPMPGKTFTPVAYPPKPEIYESDKPYPDLNIRLTGSGTLSGYQIAHVEIRPLHYTPSTGKLVLTTRLVYRLRYLENQTDGTVATIDQRDIFGEEARSLVVNPEMVELFAPRIMRRNSRALPPGDYKYVIISGATSLDSIFQRLADWKTKKGIPATVVQISYVNTNYTGYDLQEKVRNFIADAKATWGAIYILLGGSGDYNSSGQNLVPTRKGWYTSAGGPDGDNLPADLYYSDLTGTWDADGDHTYGELTDNVNMYGDIYVGRASVYTIAQARNFVYKTLTYEKNPPTAYLKKMLLPTAILWSSYEERPMQNAIANMTPAGWVDGKLYEREGTLSPQAMVDSMNAGFGLGAWEGHGDENGIYMGSTPYLSSTAADGLVNGDKQGINISIACMTGGWDLVSAGSDCFAEHLVNRVGGGLVVSMMNARYGWGAYVGSSYVPGPSERLDTTFYAKIFQGGMHKCGQILSVDKDTWVPYADSGNQYDMTRWCIYELNLFGDPELPLWSNTPGILAVTFPSVIQIGNQNIMVTVTGGGSPVNNALVCLKKGAEVYVYGNTNVSGQVSLNVSPTSPGYMDITVTAKNYYPFEDTIIVQSSAYAYVSYLKSLVSDPTPGGNNDGKLNPGESVEIPLWVKNYGSQQGNSISGRLRTADTYVALSDTVKSFGNIPTNDSATTGSNGFNAVVAGNCPNGHGVLLTLVCKDASDSTWTSQFSLPVYAPVLTYQSVSVTGGNGNGILDPGETVNLVVTIKNDGGAAAQNVTSTLMENSAYLSISDASGNYGTVAVGGTANNAGDPYTVTAAAGTPVGTTVPLQIQVVSGVYCDTLDFSLVIGKKHYYLWNPDPTPAPGQNMNTILAALGYTGDYGASLAADLSYYQAVLVCVGVYANNYVISSGSAEATRLANFLQNQAGRMYLEGGDVWYYDPTNGGYNFNTLFGINATADGSSDMGPVVGQAGTFTAGMNFTGYTGENNWMDHISATGTDAFLIFRDGNNSYDCGVARSVTSGHRTVGTSFELGLLTDASGVSTRAVLLDSIMRFFGCQSAVCAEENLDLLLAGRSLLVYPTVTRGRLSIAYNLGDRAQAAGISIYDISGRLVKSFTLKAAPLTQSVIWKGDDQAGRRVASGVYFVKLNVDGKETVEKAVMLR
jgi:hypothetical protein